MACRKSIKLIAFDLGGVLVDVDKEKVDDTFFKPDFFYPLMRGELTSMAYFKQLSILLEKSELQIENKFREMVTPKLYSGNLLRSLVTPFTYWSNINQCHFEHLVGISKSLRSYSQTPSLSFEMGYLKPEAHFFRSALNQTNLHASEILFLDDREANIITALDMQIEAHLVTSDIEVTQILNDRNLLRG